MSGLKDALLGDTPYVLSPPTTFQGETYLHDRDYARLNAQCQRVFNEMRDGKYHTLRELAEQTGDPEASISARLRDIRAALRPNGFDIGREYVRRGLHRYRIQRTQVPA